MKRNKLKLQASSSRAAGVGFGGFGSVASSSSLSYLTEPPDLSTINNPHISLVLKTLGKKDETTRTKALQELRIHINAQVQGNAIEDQVIEAWVRIYPRLAIDISRLVRDLSHSLQYDLLSCLQKRMSRYVSKFVGSWLSGQFDRDRMVASNVSNAINSFLQTDNKRVAFYARHQTAALKYAYDALQETPETLSDERAISREEMRLKYFTVLGSSISLVVELLRTLDEAELIKLADDYEKFLSDEKLWNLVHCEDSHVQRIVCDLLILCCKKQREIVAKNLETLVKAFIQKGLREPHLGTAPRLLDALGALTADFPEVWGSSYSEKTRKMPKKSPLKIISSFISRASRLEHYSVWTSLQQLIQVIPGEILPNDIENAAEFLQILETSIAQKNEVRQGRKNVWYSYLKIAEFLSIRLTDCVSKSNLVERSIFPLFRKYLNITPNSFQVSGNLGHKDDLDLDVNIILEAYTICFQHDSEAHTFHSEWEHLGSEVIKKIQTSLPEQSDDYCSSQDLVIRLGQRWFSLLSKVLNSPKLDGKLQINNDPLFTQSKYIIEAAFKTMIARDGKPYCAAGILETAVSLASKLFTSDPNYLNIVRDAVMVHLPKLIHSRSASFLIKIIFHLPSIDSLEEYFEPSWSSAVDSFLSSVNTLTIRERVQLAIGLISNNKVAPLALKHQRLQEYFLQEIDSYALGDYSSKSILCVAFQSNAISEISAISARDSMIEYLSEKYDLDGTFFILGLLNDNLHHLLGRNSKFHVNLLIKLLEIKEKALSQQEVDLKFAEQSQTLMTKIMGDTPMDSTLQLISIGMENGAKKSSGVSIGYLIQEAKKIIVEADCLSIPNPLLPDTESWRECLLDLLNEFPEVALAARPDFGSIAYLIKTDSNSEIPVLPSFDTQGLTMQIRKAIYTAELLPLFYKTLDSDTLTNLLEVLALTFEIAESDASFMEESRLFSSNISSDSTNSLDNFLRHTPSKLRILTKDARYWHQGVIPRSCLDNNLEKAKFCDIGNFSLVMQHLIMRLINTCRLRQPVSFYAAQALSRLLDLLLQESDNDFSFIENWLSSLNLIKLSTENVIGTSAILIGLGKHGESSKTVETLCNKLVSNILDLTTDSDDLLGQLILINSCLGVYNNGVGLPVVQNRLVFAVKHIISWTEGLQDSRIMSEVCKSLLNILPSVKNIYGSFWEESLNLCVSIWTKQKEILLDDENLAVMSMSLKLYSQLKEIDDSNDDLNEALIDLQDQSLSCLLDLLFLKRPKNYKPLQQMVDQALANLIFSFPVQEADNIVRFYPLLASRYLWVQSASFVLIHRRLSTLQQQLSVDVALDNKVATFSDELLSLIVSVPSHPDQSMLDNNSYIISPEFVASVRCYLLAWLLIFEAFSASSYKVRNDYIDILKTQKCIGPLMGFIFRALGLMDDKPIDLKKEGLCTAKIREYNLQSSLGEQNLKKDLFWILVNLYFQALKYAPSVVKSWWLDAKKQTKTKVCSWTEKYISPILVDEELSTVINWAENQESPEDEGKNLIVRVAKKVREVSVGYEIDDMVMQILIRVPESYPLDLVKIESVNRVGITAQRWNSFLMTTHGVINFSNGSISDALFVFRKNVLGALKGHVECAICYSIISTTLDRRPARFGRTSALRVLLFPDIYLLEHSISCFMHDRINTTPPTTSHST
ncbi:hypothetical protein K3495_g9521 [Podosphaera aphanis]|nr:hypothetical protein K3495_g9521 [Podosphaera aphanis]